jgi:DNA-binding response OmpR family regulator
VLHPQPHHSPEAGADDYVTKPFDVTDLVLRVRLWLRRVSPAAPVGPPGVRIHPWAGCTSSTGPTSG